MSAVAPADVYAAAMASLLAGEQLERDRASALMAALVGGDLGAARVAAVLTALAMRPPGAEALIGFAQVLRERARRLPIDAALAARCLDTCGTGGSGLSTPNTSTMVAFLLAAAGMPITKHGNRKSSGRCGSVDVLEALGVRVELSPEEGAALLAAHGVVLLFAPLYHPAVGMVMPVRREIGFRTVFNLLGPLANPAGAGLQLLGVSDEASAPAMAAALAGLGVQRALVVRGDDGLDELTLSGASTYFTVAKGVVSPPQRLQPEDVGLVRAEAELLRGGDVADNAAQLESVLRGAGPAAVADCVILNAAAGLLVADRVPSLAAGVAEAKALLATGAAWRRFCAYRDASRALGRT